MLRHRLNSREERRRINPLTFSNWINTNEGIIRYIAPSDPTATNRQVYNRNVAGVEDSRLFPKANVIINPSFTADTDWTKGDAAITIAGGKATWSGAQAGDADLTATVAPLTSGDRYGRNIVLSGVSAGTLTPLFGTQAGAAMDASGTYPIDEQVANGTAFVLRGDSDFVGSCELVEIPPKNPLNASIIGATVAQRFSRGLPWANFYDGINDLDPIYSTALNTVYNRAEHTLLIFIKMDDADWNTFTRRTAMRIRANAANMETLEKNSAPYEWRWFSVGGGTQSEFVQGSITPDVTKMFAITRSESADRVNYFMDDMLLGSSSSIGTTAGTPLSPTDCVIGASFVPISQPFAGLISDGILHPTRAMPHREIIEYYRRWRAG